MAWDVVLKDSSEPLNARMNEEVEAFLERVNRRAQPLESREELVIELYLYLFQGLHASRIRGYVNQSPQVDRYPDRPMSFYEYQRLSIHRGLSFPYVLPMARTIRIGDVYLGTDKIGHFFGFGRRYFQRYLRHREEGMEEKAAMERAIRWGIAIEESFVGKLVDGIFSHADLEANFQGFRMAKDLCCAEPPYFVREGDLWRAAREIDLRDYVTPDFDESYNVSHYWALRKRNVLPILKEEYCPKRHSPLVEKRFARYREYEPSFSKRVIAEYFEEKGSNPQQAQSLEAICEAKTTEDNGDGQTQ